MLGMIVSPIVCTVLTQGSIKLHMCVCAKAAENSIFPILLGSQCPFDAENSSTLTADGTGS